MFHLVTMEQYAAKESWLLKAQSEATAQRKLDMNQEPRYQAVLVGKLSPVTPGSVGGEVFFCDTVSSHKQKARLVLSNRWESLEALKGHLKYCLE